MKKFAQISSTNKVLNIVAVPDSVATDEAAGIAHLKQHNNWPTWKQVTASRGSAGIGFTYDSTGDVFYEPQPYPSWTISTAEAKWEAPITMPTLTDDQIAAEQGYTWDEDAYQADTSDPKTAGWVLTSKT